jgi:type IV pilus assembly protein PilF
MISSLKYIEILLISMSLLQGCGPFPHRGEDDKPDETAENNMLRGIEYMKIGQYDVALKLLKTALEDDPYYAEAHGTLAVLYENIGENKQADQHHHRAVQLKPKDSNIQNNYGQFLCKQGQAQAADVHFLAAAKNPLYRTPYIPYTNAALCALHNNDVQKAETYLREALQINPAFEQALYQMAELQHQQGNNQQARDYLKRYSAVAKHTPQTLWLNVLVERALHNESAAISYARLLRSQYPDAQEIQLLNQMGIP